MQQKKNYCQVQVNELYKELKDFKDANAEIVGSSNVNVNIKNQIDVLCYDQFFLSFLNQKLVLNIGEDNIETKEFYILDLLFENGFLDRFFNGEIFLSFGGGNAADFNGLFFELFREWWLNLIKKNENGESELSDELLNFFFEIFAVETEQDKIKFSDFWLKGTVFNSGLPDSSNVGNLISDFLLKSNDLVFETKIDIPFVVRSFFLKEKKWKELAIYLIFQNIAFPQYNGCKIGFFSFLNTYFSLLAYSFNHNKNEIKSILTNKKLLERIRNKDINVDLFFDSRIEEAKDFYWNIFLKELIFLNKIINSKSNVYSKNQKDEIIVFFLERKISPKIAAYLFYKNVFKINGCGKVCVNEQYGLLLPLDQISNKKIVESFGVNNCLNNTYVDVEEIGSFCGELIHRGYNTRIPDLIYSSLSSDWTVDNQEKKQEEIKQRITELQKYNNIDILDAYIDEENLIQNDEYERKRLDKGLNRDVFYENFLGVCAGEGRRSDDPFDNINFDNGEGNEDLKLDFSKSIFFVRKSELTNYDENDLGSWDEMNNKDDEERERMLCKVSPDEDKLIKNNTPVTKKKNSFNFTLTSPIEQNFFIWENTKKETTITAEQIQEKVKFSLKTKLYTDAYDLSNQKWLPIFNLYQLVVLDKSNIAYTDGSSINFNLKIKKVPLFKIPLNHYLAVEDIISWHNENKKKLSFVISDNYHKQIDLLILSFKNKCLQEQKYQINEQVEETKQTVEEFKQNLKTTPLTIQERKIIIEGFFRYTSLRDISEILYKKRIKLDFWLNKFDNNLIQVDDVNDSIRLEGGFEKFTVNLWTGFLQLKKLFHHYSFFFIPIIGLENKKREMKGFSILSRFYKDLEWHKQSVLFNVISDIKKYSINVLKEIDSQYKFEYFFFDPKNDDFIMLFARETRIYFCVLQALILINFYNKNTEKEQVENQLLSFHLNIFGFQKYLNPNLFIKITNSLVIYSGSKIVFEGEANEDCLFYTDINSNGVNKMFEICDVIFSIYRYKQKYFLDTNKTSMIPDVEFNIDAIGFNFGNDLIENFFYATELDKYSIFFSRIIKQVYCNISSILKNYITKTQLSFQNNIFQIKEETVLSYKKENLVNEFMAGSFIVNAFFNYFFDISFKDGFFYVSRVAVDSHYQKRKVILLPFLKHDFRNIAKLVRWYPESTNDPFIKFGVFLLSPYYKTSDSFVQESFYNFGVNQTKSMLLEIVETYTKKHIDEDADEEEKDRCIDEAIKETEKLFSDFLLKEYKVNFNGELNSIVETDIENLFQQDKINLNRDSNSIIEIGMVDLNIKGISDSLNVEIKKKLETTVNKISGLINDDEKLKEIDNNINDNIRDVFQDKVILPLKDADELSKNIKDLQAAKEAAISEKNKLADEKTQVEDKLAIAEGSSIFPKDEDSLKPGAKLEKDVCDLDSSFPINVDGKSNEYYLVLINSGFSNIALYDNNNSSILPKGIVSKGVYVLAKKTGTEYYVAESIKVGEIKDLVKKSENTSALDIKTTFLNKNSHIIIPISLLVVGLLTGLLIMILLVKFTNLFAGFLSKGEEIDSAEEGAIEE